MNQNHPKKHYNINTEKNSSLDNTSITCRWASNKEKRKARFWNRILSFITRLQSRKIKGYRFAFLTLTSSLESDNNHILDNWNILKKRIQRKYGKVYAFIVREFNDKHTLIHLHILFYAPYIPQNWLSSNWNDIHKAKIVYIEGIQETQVKSITGYLAKYVSKDFETSAQISAIHIRRFTYSRFFHSISKLWKAYTKDYIKTYGYNISDMLKWWNYYITKYDDWDYPTISNYIVSI